ncbi:MAG: CotH kinase family protein [Ruminococcus sp.]
MKLQQKAAALAICAAISISSVSTSVLQAYAADEKTIFINEVCAQNQSIAAPDGGYYDYIELFNASQSTVDVSGWGLSDKASKPYRYTLPEGTAIPAHGYLLVYFDGSVPASEGMLLASFGLSVSGETLTLTNSAGQQADTLTYENLGLNRTYGRKPDGSDTFAEMSMTPGCTNAAAVVYVPKPVFSAESGFYEEGFDLSLSCNEAYEIYYTLDGSDPTTSETAMLYEGETISVCDPSDQPNVHSAHAFSDGATAVSLQEYTVPANPVDKAMIVRACARSANHMYSEIVTKSYFVGYTDKADYYEDMTVVSLVTDPDNLFHPDTGIYVVGNQFYEWMESDDYQPIENIWDKNLPTNFYSDGRAWERPASISIFEKGQQSFSQNVGIQIHGSSTRNSVQKSFNVYARSEYGDTKIRYDLFDGNNLDEWGNVIDKYDSFTLRHWANQNGYNDALSAELSSGRENATLMNKPCVVFLDGEFWGFYYIQEKISKYYLETHYNVSEDDAALIKQYEVKEGTGQDYSDYDALCKFVRNNDMSQEENYRYFCSQMDVDSLIDFFCIGIYLGTWDWPNWNYGVWRNNGTSAPGNPYSDGKWRFISYDFDYTQGSTYESYGGLTGYSYDYLERVLNQQSSGYPGWLLKYLLENDTFREKFCLVYQDYCNIVMDKTHTLARLDEYHEINRDILVDTMDRYWGGTGNLWWYQKHYEENKETNQAFFENRSAYALPQLKYNLEMTGDLQQITLTHPEGFGTVTVNTAQPSLENGSWTGSYYSDYPLTITAEPENGRNFLYWSITDADGTRQEENLQITVNLTSDTLVEAVYEGMPILGDVNLDGMVSLPDAVLLQKYLAGQTALTAEQLTLADIQTNACVNIFDLALLKKMIG